GAVVVAHHQQVGRGRHVERVAVDLDHASVGPQAHERAGDLVAATRDGEQVDPVDAAGGGAVGDLDAAIGGELGCVHVRDRFVGDRADDPLEDRQGEDARVV